MESTCKHTHTHISYYKRNRHTICAHIVGNNDIQNICMYNKDFGAEFACIRSRYMCIVKEY